MVQDYKFCIQLHDPVYKNLGMVIIVLVHTNPFITQTTFYFNTQFIWKCIWHSDIKYWLLG